MKKFFILLLVTLSVFTCCIGCVKSKNEKESEEQHEVEMLFKYPDKYKDEDVKVSGIVVDVVSSREKFKDDPEFLEILEGGDWITVLVDVNENPDTKIYFMYDTNYEDYKIEKYQNITVEGKADGIGTFYGLDTEGIECIHILANNVKTK